MSDFAQIRRAAVEIEGPRDGSLEARAALVFKGLAFVNAAGVVLAVFPPITPVSTLLTLGFNAAAAALAIVYWFVGRGLDRKLPWAVAAVRPLLALVAIAGVYSVVVAFGEGKLRIPFEVVLAGWALVGPPDVTPLPRLSTRSIATLVGTLALLAALAFGHTVFGWGGALDVRQPDLDAEIAATCGEPGSGPPETIAVTYDWSWLRTTPVPSGVDMIVLGWTGADSDGRPLYIVGRIPDTPTGIRAGLEGYPSAELAKAVQAESEGRYRWAIDLSRQQLAAGRIELGLQFARDEVPETGTLVLKATYIHLGLWREDTTLTCTW